MKWIKPLCEAEIITLTQAHLYAPSPGLRRRAQALLLSHKGYKINEIAAILDSHRNRVSAWIDHWEQRGLRGLMDEPRSGRRRRYDEAEETRLLELVVEEPRQLKAVQARLQEETGKTSCLQTLKRILKKNASPTNARGAR